MMLSRTELEAREVIDRGREPKRFAEDDDDREPSHRGRELARGSVVASERVGATLIEVVADGARKFSVRGGVEEEQWSDLEIEDALEELRRRTRRAERAKGKTR